MSKNFIGTFQNLYACRSFPDKMQNLTAYDKMLMSSIQGDPPDAWKKHILYTKDCAFKILGSLVSAARNPINIEKENALLNQAWQLRPVYIQRHNLEAFYLLAIFGFEFGTDLVKVDPKTKEKLIQLINWLLKNEQFVSDN